MRAFNLEAARRGEPIAIMTCSKESHPMGWVTTESCTFVGVRQNGFVVIEQKNDSGANVLNTVGSGILRMAPRQTVLFIEIWRDEQGRYNTRATDPSGWSDNVCPRGVKIDTLSYALVEE